MKNLHLRKEKNNIKRILVLLIMLILFFSNTKPVFAAESVSKIQLKGSNTIQDNEKYYKNTVKVWTNNINTLYKYMVYYNNNIKGQYISKATSYTFKEDGKYTIKRESNNSTQSYDLGTFYIDRTEPTIKKCEITNDQYCAEAELTVRATDNMRNKKYNCR